MIEPPDGSERFYRILRIVLYAVGALWIAGMLVWLLEVVR